MFRFKYLRISGISHNCTSECKHGSWCNWCLSLNYIILPLECIIWCVWLCELESIKLLNLCFVPPLVETLVRAHTGIFKASCWLPWSALFVFFGCACEKSSLKYPSPGRSSVPLTLTSQSSLCLDFWDLKEAAHAAEATLWFSSETTQVSTQYLGERVSEQFLSTGPVFGFHKNAADKVPCLVGSVRGQKRVSGLGGDLEYRCHGLIFSPRWLFCQHFDHCATKTPTKDIHNKCNFNIAYSGVSKQVETNTTYFVCATHS